MTRGDDLDAEMTYGAVVIKLETRPTFLPDQGRNVLTYTMTIFKLIGVFFQLP